MKNEVTVSKLQAEFLLDFFVDLCEVLEEHGNDGVLVLDEAMEARRHESMSIVSGILREMESE